MVEWRGRWAYAVWGTLGFLAFLSGLFSENVVTMVVGSSLTLVNISAFLTSYVKSENRVKKASEVVSAIVGLGIIVYGYVLTQSLILGVVTLFIVAMLFVAFTLSYLLPRIRGKSTQLRQA